VYSLAFTRDATRLVSGHRDSSVRVSRTADGAPVHRLHHSPGPTSFVFDVALHPSEELCASACHDGTVHLWNLGTGELAQVIENLNEPGAPKEISCVSFHPGGKWMSMGGFNK
jgi:WD40 repeat protein